MTGFLFPKLQPKCIISLHYIQIYLTFFHFHHLKEVSPRTLWPVPIQAGHFLFPLYSYHLGISVLGISFTSLLNTVSLSWFILLMWEKVHERWSIWDFACLKISLCSHLIDTLAEYRNLVIFQQNCEGVVLLSSSFQCCSWEGPCYYESLFFI